MELTNRLDILDSGGPTALVCIDVPEPQRLVVEQLTAMDYRLHTGLFAEDILLKMRTHTYDVLFVAEHFNASNAESNPIVAEAIRMSAVQRRKQVVVMLGSGLRTNDELQAFQYSVDVVINLADITNLRPVLRRAVQRKQELYAPLHEALTAAGAA